MAIKHTAISYYGFNYVEHAEKDFQEMIEHGCDTVILAITEFDMDFWFPNINAIVKKAHEMGLRVLADTWGIGKYFGGEQVSLFLQNNIHHRQVSAYTGEILNAACFNTNSFRDYFKRLCMKLARETEVDGFFWDEPHYAYPKSYASITGGAGDDWACRCPECMKKFEAYYGYEMPKFMNDDVKQFRWREALETLEIVSKALKEYNPKTLPVGLASLSQMQQYATDWVTLFAALAIAFIPTLLIYAVSKKQLMEGVNAGGIKG